MSKITYPHPYYCKQDDKFLCLLCLAAPFNEESAIKEHLKQHHRKYLVNNIFKGVELDGKN